MLEDGVVLHPGAIMKMKFHSRIATRKVAAEMAAEEVAFKELVEETSPEGPVVSKEMAAIRTAEAAVRAKKI